MKSLRPILPAALLLLLALAQPGFSEEAAAPAKTVTTTDKANPVDIEADQMEVRDKEKKAIFRGKVVAKRDDVTLNCDTLTVDYGQVKQADGTTKNDVTHLDAQGNVLIVTDKQRITGDWAKMDTKTNIVNVGGGVTVTQGETKISGEQLRANLDTDQMEMTGGRVKGSFLPK